MATIRFNLKKPNSDRPTLIYLIYWIGKSRLKYSINQTIHPKFWDKNRHRAKASKGFPSHPEFNAFLDRLETEIRKWELAMMARCKVAEVESLKKHLDQLTNKTAKLTFKSFLEHVIELKKNNTALSKSSVKIYETLKSHIIKFNAKLSLEDIDMHFFHSFRDYLYDNNAGQNHARKLMKHVKATMNIALEEGKTTNTKWNTTKFSIPEVRVQSIYLSLDELKKISEADLPTSLDNARRLFLIGAYTGLRFSDFTRLSKEMISKEGNLEVIKMASQKTGGHVTIPIHPEVKKIIDSGLPKSVSNAYLNRHLKEIGKLSGIKSKVSRIKNVGGKNITIQQSKFELITTHTARRSFCTNAFLSKVPSYVIMSISGHKTESEFMKYIGISKLQSAKMISESRFFGQLKVI